MFTLTTTLLQISGKPLRWLYLTVCTCVKRVLIFIWETEIGHFNEMLFVTPSCSRGYEALLMMIHFMPRLFITVGLACASEPDSCWAAVLWVHTLFSLLYQFNCTNSSSFFSLPGLQPSVNLTLFFKPGHLVVTWIEKCSPNIPNITAVEWKTSDFDLFISQSSAQVEHLIFCF